MSTTRSLSPFLFFLPLALLFSSNPSEAMVPVSVDSSMHVLEQLADPVRFEGRKSGAPGGDSAMSWIADQFERWRLQPLIGDDFLVPYDQLVTKEVVAKLALVDDPRYGDFELKLGEDFTACTNSGSGVLTAPVTLVGYGISKPDKGWDDYGKTKVKGRIAIIKRGRPNNDQDWDEEFSRTYLYGEAVKRGAVAVFFYSGAWPVNGAAIVEKAYNPDVPVGYIGDSVMRLLLTYSETSWKEYQRKLKQGPYPLDLDRQLAVEFQIDKIENGRGFNVAGIVPGTDPVLSKEAVIIGGHGDHVGPNAEGVLYVGADDNGSGASTVIELARAFASAPQKRTLVFAVFGGEEQGLLGSRALASELPDDYHYVNMINLDMVGRGQGITGFGGGDQLSEVWDSWFGSLPDSLRSYFSVSRAWGGEASDHAPFRNAGIPAFTIWSHGSHDYYHRPDDLFDTIERPAMKSALISSALWIEEIAGYDQPLAERHLAQRALWHQGTPIAHVLATRSPTTDIAKLWSNLASGYMGSIYLFPTPQEERLANFTLRLESFSEALGSNPDILPVQSLREMRSNARSAHGSVLLALKGDDLTANSVQYIKEWHDAGLSWLVIRDPEAWLAGDAISEDMNDLLKAIRTEALTVELPLASADNIFPLLEYLGSQALLRGSLSSFKDLKSSEVERLKTLGVHVVVEAPPTVLKRAVKMSDELSEVNVHLQPSDEGYEPALLWVEQLQELGLEDKEIVRWIGGNMGRW